MGISNKSKDIKRGELETPNHHNNWKIQLIRASLHPIRITNNYENDDDEWCSTTPTSEESRIPDKACPPPPPRKQRKTAASGRGCNYGGTGTTNATTKDFFCPPDLDTVFTRRHVS